MKLSMQQSRATLATTTLQTLWGQEALQRHLNQRNTLPTRKAFDVSVRGTLFIFIEDRVSPAPNPATILLPTREPGALGRDCRNAYTPNVASVAEPTTLQDIQSRLWTFSACIVVKAGSKISSKLRYILRAAHHYAVRGLSLRCPALPSLVFGIGRHTAPPLGRWTFSLVPSFSSNWRNIRLVPPFENCRAIGLSGFKFCGGLSPIALGHSHVH